MDIGYKKTIVSNFLALGIVQGANFILPILVMPFVIRKIGADGFGVVSVAQVVMIFLSTFSDYGFNLTGARDIAVHKGNVTRISTIFSTVLVCKMLISGISLLLLVILVAWVPVFHAHPSLYLLGFVYVIGQSLLPGWFFQGMEKMHFIAICNLASRVLFVVLIFLFIRRREDEVFFLFFLGLGNILAGVMGICFALRMFRLKFAIPLRSNIVTELRSGWQLTVSNLSINVCQYSNIFILRMFTGDLIVGYYSIAEKIFFAARQVLAIFSQAIYPQVCLLAQKGRSALWLLFRQIYLPFLVMVLGGCSATFVFAQPIIRFFIKTQDQQPVILLRMLSFAPLVVCLNIPAYQLLLTFNRRKSYLRVFTLATFLNIAANLVLVQYLQAIGTTVAILLTEGFIVVGLYMEIFRSDLYTRKSDG
jgi:polysaccharide transporter, PST family